MITTNNPWSGQKKWKVNTNYELTNYRNQKPFFLNSIKTLVSRNVKNTVRLLQEMFVYMFERKERVFLQFMCEVSESLTQQGCHQRCSLFHFFPAGCFSAHLTLGNQDSIGALIQSWRDAMGENSGTEVATKTHKHMQQRYQVCFSLQLTVHCTHSSAEVDHWWGQFHLNFSTLEDESDFKSVHCIAVVRESQGTRFTFWNWIWAFSLNGLNQNEMDCVCPSMWPCSHGHNNTWLTILTI